MGSKEYVIKIIMLMGRFKDTTHYISMPSAVWKYLSLIKDEKYNLFGLVLSNEIRLHTVLSSI